MRKLIVLATAVLSVLALAAGANAATLGFTSHDQVQTPTAHGFAVEGGLVNAAEQFGEPVGATVGRWMAELQFDSPSSASVAGVFVVPGGHIIVGGTANMETGLSNLSARSLGTRRGSGTLSVGDDGTTTQFLFELN